ncbi:hypothetical protein thsrh120_63240 [Rhizobium sp. No.120]
MCYFGKGRENKIMPYRSRGTGMPKPKVLPSPAMQQSLHKSVAQAASDYNNAERKNGRAARLFL